MLELKACGYATVASMLGLIVFGWCADRTLARGLFGRLIVLTLVIQTSAFLAPSLLVFNLVGLLLVPLLAADRRQIAPMYLYGWLTAPLVSTQLSTGGLYLVNYDIGVSLGLGALFALILRQGGTFRRSPMADVAILLLVTILAVANARSTSLTNVARVVIEQALHLLLPYFVISRSVRSPADARWAIGGIVAATAALSTLALYEASHTWPIYRTVWAHFDVPLTSEVGVKLRGGLLRSAGPFPEPTSFAVCLSIGTLAALVCRSLFRTPLHRTALAGLMLVGICAPQSRGAWLGLLAGMVAADVMQRHYASLGRKIGVLAAGGLALLAAGTINKTIGSLLGLYADGMVTEDYRMMLFHRGLAEIWQHPLLGQSIDQVLSDLRDLIQGEGIVDFVNTYIYVGLIAGMAGLAVFMIVLLMPTVSLWIARKRFAGRGERSLAAYMFGAIVAMAVMLAATSLGGRSSAMLVIAVALAGTMTNSVRKRSRLESHPPPLARLPA